MNRLIKISGLILLFFVVITCKKHDDTPAPGEIVIAKQANVIDSVTWKNQFISLDSTNYTVTFSDGIANKIKVGDIIVSAGGEGLLRKISSVQTANNKTIVQTEAAALTDVVQQGLIEYDQPLTMAQISSIEYNYAGMELKKVASKGADQSQFSWDINVVLYDHDNDKTTTNDQVKLAGNLNCDWRLGFKIDIGFLGNLKEVKFSFTSNESLDLGLIAGVEYQLEKEVTLATVNFSPITVFAGAVPVVFTPQLKIKVGIDGSASASVTTGISQSMSFEAGMQYLKGRGWAPYNTFTKDLEFNPPQLNMNASAEAYLKPEMLIKVYSVGGPFANLKLYSRLDADISATPWWVLYGGISMSAGAKVDILNRYVLEYTVNDLIKYEKILAQATTPRVLIPTLTTVAASEITPATAKSGGDISSDGGAQVTERGICWNTSGNPTIDLPTKTSNGTGTGPFTSNLAGLTSGTKYYIRAYATNSVGTAYGQQVSFTAQETVTDGQGNTYKVVKVGNQTWMAENLRYLPSVSGPESGSKTAPYYYVYGYSGTDVAQAKATVNYTTYGVLYNWPAAMNGEASSLNNPSGVQGVCPTGWHLPSLAELSDLEAYLGGSGVAGGKLKETGVSHWLDPNGGATNEVGFAALPGGYRHPTSVFSAMGEWGYLWSTSQNDSEIAGGKQMSNANGALYGYIYYKDWGFSVRCVKN